MGVDVLAFGKLRKINPALIEYGALVDGKRNWKPIPNWVKFVRAEIEFTEQNWPGRTDGIVPDQIYSFGDKRSFRAGGTGGFYNWRQMLARFALGMSIEQVRKKGVDGPFVELIDFGDTRGIIGPRVAAKLASDFMAHRARAEVFAAELADGGNDWLWRYCEWRQSCEMAADGALMLF